MFYNDKENDSIWLCHQCIFSYLPDFNLELNVDNFIFSENIKVTPDESFKTFIDSCKNIILNNTEEEEGEENLFNNINSKYYDLHNLNQIKTEASSTLGILHTNLASLYKYFDDLNHIISIIKPEFQIIGITEHKIKDSIPTSNIEIAGYHEFIFNPTQTSHGGTGFYVKDNLAVKKRDNLLLKSPGPGEFEFTFLEIVFPNQKN